MGFEYYSAREAESFAFYRIPKELVCNKRYRRISDGAILLYGMLFDRQGLSLKNGWLDEEGHVFIYYTLDEICFDMNVSRKKAVQTLDELEYEAELIRRRRQGQGRPNCIYVGRFMSSEVKDGNFKECKKETSESVENELPEVSGGDPNKNDYRKTDTSKSDSIVSIRRQGEEGQTDAIDGMDERGALRAWFERQCCFEVMKHDFPLDEEILEEILELMIEVCSSKTGEIRIGGEMKNADVVKSRFMKLDSEHIRYVLQCFSENTTEVRNVRQYLLTSLYNAPTTISSYYKARVSHDLYGTRKGGGYFGR